MIIQIGKEKYDILTIIGDIDYNTKTREYEKLYLLET